MKAKLGDWITGGWRLLTARWQVWCVMMGIFVLPIGMVYGFSQYISLKTQPRITGSFLEIMSRSMTQSLTIGILTAFVVAIVASVFVGGLYRAAIKQARGEEIEISDLFSGVGLYVKVLVAMLIIGFLEYVGTMMCFFPAFIVRGMTFLTIPLIVDKGMEPLDALKASFEATKSDWLMWTLVGFVIPLLAALGIFACGVGFIFSYGLLFTCSGVAYRDCFDAPVAEPNPVDRLYSKECRNCKKMIPVRSNFCEFCGAGQT